MDYQGVVLVNPCLQNDIMVSFNGSTRSIIEIGITLPHFGSFPEIIFQIDITCIG
jgi:hypothetical protein